MPLGRILGILTGALAAALAAYLALWPVPIEPVAWTPPPDPGFEGPYARNDVLAGAERLFEDELPGPDFILADRRGKLVTALRDGRLVQFDPGQGTVQALGLFGGRPLGFAHTPVGAYLAAEPVRGLVGVRGRRTLPLRVDLGDHPARYIADVVVTEGGEVYLLDASSKFGLDQGHAEFLERAANGRLIHLDDINLVSQSVVSGLHFPTGLALGPDDAYLLISETTAYRVTRYWLSGDKAGQSEPFVENLPGYPAHITWNGRDTFWLALYAPRIAALERWADAPALRKLMFRLPRFLQPGPARHAIVLGLDPAGRVTHNLQHAGGEAYAPVTSVREHDGWLYLGSRTRNGIARIRAPGA